MVCCTWLEETTAPAIYRQSNVTVQSQTRGRCCRLLWQLAAAMPELRLLTGQYDSSDDRHHIWPPLLAQCRPNTVKIGLVYFEANVVQDDQTQLWCLKCLFAVIVSFGLLSHVRFCGIRFSFFGSAKCLAEKNVSEMMYRCVEWCVKLQLSLRQLIRLVSVVWPGYWSS